MTLEEQVFALFEPLRRVGGTMPAPGTMGEELSNLAPKLAPGDTRDVAVGHNIVKLYATSSVEMWLRSVHTFLMSGALTRVSPLWASVSGYYASHYTVRGIAHLLGFCHLHKKGYVVQLLPSTSGFICRFSRAKGLERKEHAFYWIKVKQHRDFSSNQLFTENLENVDESDCAHRNYANYIDHLEGFPRFDPLTYDELKRRIDFLSKIEVVAYPIPNKNKYPDIESVQIVAYHRIVEFRELLNRALGDSNKYWLVYRNPDWSRGILTFQRVKPRSMTIGDT